ncbi:DUF3604 domain-containing protein [Parahaliea aestuarii]|uniref:DUF3604 domain-containing protein n=1 Tax=Parahaliea aestuarii TaxID=1852021 RepID=A0A5C8ZY94_9GAMM|nr:DUF3604 domain-containing protein [Parahaliea aestuarii]TXS93448.1 DUF3604 domain-containing protein [Parahaliea aestuarii]
MKAPVAALLALLAAPSLAAPDYSEQRQPCSDYQTQKQAFFGDLHVHTRYSLDASTQGTRTTPAQAYAFARGEKLPIQPWTDEGEGRRSLQLRRPLDFAMVSDHSELIGEVAMCNTPGMEGYNSWQCLVYRHWPRGAFYLFNAWASIQASHLGLCGENDELCLEAAKGPWREMQEAAEAHYDRSADCSFTTFVGYEWTGGEAESGGNLHRNVVFRNAEVPPRPISFIDGPAASSLWHSLDQQCNSADGACDSLVIPHNANLSAGYMYSGLKDDGSPMDADYARLRKQFEPLAEIMQHKGASECFYQAGVTQDELCAFEQQPIDNISGFDNPPGPETGFLREALGEGMQIERQLGVNPYQQGFIASTDTHLGSPGAVEEDRFLGHGGAGVPAAKEIPPGLPDKLEYNPGGLAVLWAEENSRDALFRAMRRREAYGTSGPRIEARFFAGWDYPENLCDQQDRIEQAYAGGVPMGGELAAPPSAAARPTFLLAARQDSGTADHPGMPLQRLQMVKSWLDADGERHETVLDVAGDGGNGAGVDTATCATHGEGFAELCTVWQDADFNPQQPAYYYSRVVENPSCRWSQRQCIAAGVSCDDPDSVPEAFANCCAAEHRPVVQERAWTSPVWYTPAS